MASTNINAGALTIQPDTQKLLQVQKRIDENSFTINRIVDKVVRDYAKELDLFVDDVKDRLKDEDNPPTNQELERYVLCLPLMIYEAIDAQETLGLKEDIAKAIRMEIYNTIHEEAQKTVADKRAAAELATQDEYVAYIIYQRAYKKLKLKIDAAQEVLHSIKKVLGKRVVELEVLRNGT